jgi:tetratricopeptide (TPR) repeat protein
MRPASCEDPVKKRRLLAFVPLVLLSAGCESEQKRLEDLYTQAAAAVEAGDHTQAVELFDELIAARPQAGLYFERALAKTKSGDDAGAREDCALGLELNPENRDLKWLLGEIKKEPPQRFKGKNQQPPGRSK